MGLEPVVSNTFYNDPKVRSEDEPYVFVTRFKELFYFNLWKPKYKNWVDHHMDENDQICFDPKTFLQRWKYSEGKPFFIECTCIANCQALMFSPKKNGSYEIFRFVQPSCENQVSRKMANYAKVTGEFMLHLLSDLEVGIQINDSSKNKS